MVIWLKYVLLKVEECLVNKEDIFDVSRKIYLRFLFIVMLYVVLRDKLKSKNCFFMKFFVNIL